MPRNITHIDQVINGGRPYALIQGDCLDVMRKVRGGAIDAVIVDPPYGMFAHARMLEITNSDYRCKLSGPTHHVLRLRDKEAVA